MKHAIFSVLVFSLVLAACGAAPEPIGQEIKIVDPLMTVYDSPANIVSNVQIFGIKGQYILTCDGTNEKWVWTVNFKYDASAEFHYKAIVEYRPENPGRLQIYIYGEATSATVVVDKNAAIVLKNYSPEDNANALEDMDALVLLNTEALKTTLSGIEGEFGGTNAFHNGVDANFSCQLNQ